MNKEQIKKLEADLWRAADALRANSDLKASEYSTPVLGLIFLKFADNKYRQHEAAILAEYQKLKGTRRDKPLSDIAIEHCGFYLPDHARYQYLLKLPEKDDIARALQKAMEAIEEYKPELQSVLPQQEYFRLTRSEQNKGMAQRLLKIFDNIAVDAAGDLFGKIYEYFLANFAKSEGQGGGEFFTPRSVVKLMVEIIEPHGGKVFDPACGSGGMFVQSAEFVAAHREDVAAQGKAEDSIYVYGQEKTLETVKLAKMNLTNAELARRMGVSPAYITKVFRGPSNLSIETLTKLADAIGCRVHLHLANHSADVRWFDVIQSPRSFQREIDPGAAHFVKIREQLKPINQEDFNGQNFALAA